MRKWERQEKLMGLIRRSRVANQAQLVRRLKRSGFMVDQSLVSRDLREIGVVKVNGYYHLQRAAGGDALNGDVADIDTAGDTLVVVKTHVGRAQAVAHTIDQQNFPEIVGTVAGDDTIFVAVRGKEQQLGAIKQIVKLFNPDSFGPRELRG